MKRLIALLAFVVGCGGQTGHLNLTIVVSPSDDPFAGAAKVRISVGDAMHVTTSPVSGGHFSLTYTRPPTMTSGPITVEALDAGDKVIAHGSTPAIALSAMDQAVAVWVGRPGITQPAASALPTARSQIAAVNIAGLGAILAGGADANGAPIADDEIYDVYVQQVLQTSMMSKPRASAIVAPAGDVHDVVFGGLTSANMVDGTMELFDPTMGLGVWSPVPVTGFAARSSANSIVLGSGNALVTGGKDGNGNPLADGALITASGKIALTALATPMAAPRVGHAVAPAHFTDGDGAILFGGLDPNRATMLPVAERLVGQAFAAYDVGMQGNRRNATATKVASGDVLVLGGLDDTGAPLQSGLIITPNVPTPTVTPLAMAMSEARSGHSASLSGGDLVVCGGSDASGKALASCDVLDGTTFIIKRSFNLAAARTGHAAVVLDNGQVVLAGGLGSDGKPLASIEIYTP